MLSQLCVLSARALASSCTASSDPLQQQTLGFSLLSGLALNTHIILFSCQNSALHNMQQPLEHCANISNSRPPPPNPPSVGLLRPRPNPSRLLRPKPLLYRYSPLLFPSSASEARIIHKHTSRLQSKVSTDSSRPQASIYTHRSSLHSPNGHPAERQYASIYTTNHLHSNATLGTPIHCAGSYEYL